MTIYEFTALSYEHQLATVYEAGTYVARRWQEVNEAVLLYELPGRFFVEMTYDTDANAVLYLFSFEAGSEDDRLEDYAMFVRLPGWLPEAK